jgi:hypothetical protein
MNPNTVFSASLVTSLVLWFPSMQACLRGDLDLAPAGLRYVAALVVSRLVMTGIARLVNAYRAAPHHDSPGADALADTESRPAQRRRTDHTAGTGSGPGSLAA